MLSKLLRASMAQRLGLSSRWGAGDEDAGAPQDYGSVVQFDPSLVGDDAAAAANGKSVSVANLAPVFGLAEEANDGLHWSSATAPPRTTGPADSGDRPHFASATPTPAALMGSSDGASCAPATRESAVGATDAPATGGTAVQIVGPISTGFGAFEFEPAFPLPFDDFDSIPSGPTHSIGEGNLHELMDHLNRNDAHWDATDPDGGVTLRVAFPQELDDIPEYFRDMDELVNAGAEGLDFFDAAQQSFALQALQAWADLANVRFELVAPGEEADIYFYGKILNAEGAGGHSSGVDAVNGSRIAINVIDGWPDMQPGATSFRMLMHEIGHSLGLTHPSDYDLGDYKGYYWDAEYIEDTKMYSIMSYNSGTYTGLDPAGLNPGGVTPRTHDIYVIQELYGANWETRADDSTYGYNAEGVGDLFDFENYGGAGEFDPPLITIWDGGGEDWLDLSDDASSVTLDLRPGAFSSTHGMTYNISLAYVPAGAPDALAGYIENARGGDGNDTITGNVRANELVGNAGNDLLIGLEGDDTLKGGSGNDTLIGGSGDDKLQGGSGDDVLIGGGDGGGGDWALYGDIVSAGVTIDLRIEIQRTGGAGRDTFSGIENVGGTVQADSLKGSDRANTLLGDAGNDLIWGNGGADIIVGGAGDDQMWGGAGPDRFEFASTWGDDIVRDFEVGIDKLDFTGRTGADALLKIGMQSTAQGVLVTCGEHSILLTGVTALQAGDLLI